MVPSSGKLYHHKFKLLRLKHDSDTDDMIEYLRQRHPLYFVGDKLPMKQIIDLINRLKFRLKKQHDSVNYSTTIENSKKSELKKEEEAKKLTQ